MAKKRILLVEDENITAIDMESELVELGYEVPAIAASGAEAIGLAVDRPDLILMDITLAGEMSGIEAADQIRLAQQIPVIFLTAHLDSETVAIAKTAQPYGYLTKPCSLDSMIKIIEVALYYKSEADAKVRKINAELEDFARTVAHDLKSPLITIRGFVGRLQRNLEAGRSGHMQEYLQYIDQTAGKMEILLRDLLQLSLCGRIINAPEKIAMAQLVENVLVMLGGRIGTKGVTVSMQPDLPVVTVDRLRLSQVLQNLLENAIKYGEDQPDLHIHIGWRQDGEESVFFVQDNGVGIDHRHHESIFGLFKRQNAKSEDTGVGLALAKRVINAHGGRIWVESEGAGKGSCFCFTLGAVDFF